MKVEIITNNPYKPKRVIGDYDPKKNVFSKSVKKSKHLFIKTNAWGIDAKYFLDVPFPKNSTIKIIEKEENKIYTISAKDFKKNCEFFHFKPNRPQIFCPLRYFEVSEGKAKKTKTEKVDNSIWENKMNEIMGRVKQAEELGQIAPAPQTLF